MTSTLPEEKKKRHGGLTAGVLKVLGLFTGVQAFTILCSIVKMKLVALWLHAAGVGLFGIFNSTIETISTLSDMGLRQSAVRDVAQNRSVLSRLAMVAAVVRRWSAFAGLLGAVAISGLSWVLADIVLGDSAHWWWFAILSAALLFNSLINGEQAILQGTGLVKNIAKSSLIASLIGLLISIPMYRWLGLDSVALSIIAYSVAGVACVTFFRWRSPSRVKVKWKVVVREGQGFVRLGAFMAVAAFVSNLTQITFLSWLNGASSIEEVGYYQAGYTVVIRYVGLVFSAISMELYPRLAANAFSPRRLQLFVSHEVSLLLLIMTPLTMVFLLCRVWVIELLYSPEFLQAVPFVTLAIFGTLFRTISVSMAYVVLAKGDGKAYIVTETLDALIWLGLGIVMFRWWGLQGLGIAYIAWFGIYLAMVSWIFYCRYGLRLSGATVKISLLSLLMGATGVAIAMTLTGSLQIILLSLLTLLSLIPLLKKIRSKAP